MLRDRGGERSAMRHHADRDKEDESSYETDAGTQKIGTHNGPSFKGKGRR
jgi:hypothetical protein